MNLFFGILTALFFIGWLILAIKIAQGYFQFKPLRKEALDALPQTPLVSILIPARNEARNLGACLESLLRQDYPNFEIIVVDDRSDDDTLKIASDYAKRHPQIQVLSLKKSETGWSGKNFALHSAISLAKGQWFLFTDADTRHYAESLRMGLCYALRENSQFLTLMSQLECRGFWEKMIQPIAGGLMLMWYPPEKLNNPHNELGFANGQYMLIERSAYRALGGHLAVKEKLLEDVALSERAKELGVSFRIANGVYAVKTRMYAGFRESWNGWKRIFVHLAERNAFEIIESIAGFFVLGILPFMVLLAASLSGLTLPFKAIIAGVFLMTVGVRGFLNYLSRVPIWPALFYPVGSAVILGMLTEALWDSLTDRKTHWRGHRY